KRLATMAADTGCDTLERKTEEILADTMIVSDVHLGSSLCRAKELLTVLKKSRFNRLILLGDIFVDLNFNRLKKEHWEIFSYILKLPINQPGVEVIWVEGNHDKGSQPSSHVWSESRSIRNMSGCRMASDILPFTDINSTSLYPTT